MKEALITIFYGLMVSLFSWVFVLLLVYATSEMTDTRQIKVDCGMAVMHPDYPKKLREKCQEMRI